MKFSLPPVRPMSTWQLHPASLRNARADVRRRTRFMLASVTVVWALIALVVTSWLPGFLASLALVLVVITYIGRLVKVGRSHRSRMARLEGRVW